MSSSSWGKVVGAIVDYYTGGAGGSLVGGWFDSDTSARKQQNASMREATNNRGFQERMSSTAYQRSVHDMRAAGVNPMMAYMQGGASTPGGSMGTAVDTGSPDRVSSALQVARNKLELDNLSEANAKLRSDVLLNHAMTEKVKEDAKVSTNSAKNLDTQGVLLKTQVPRAENLKEVETTWFGKVMKYVDRILGREPSKQ